MNQTVIEAVRVMEADGTGVEYPWDPSACYLIRDDHPYLDILTRGHSLRASGDATITKLSDACEDGTQWQRWDLEEQLSRQRRLGEISIHLKVPKDCLLRCYVLPTALLSYSDVVAMAEDIEGELGLSAAWDMLANRPDRSWSRPLGKGRQGTPSEVIQSVEEELGAAMSIRRDPFTELGPRSRLGTPLAENALVSHWAARRSGQLRDLANVILGAREVATAQGALHNPEKRQIKIDAELNRLSSILSQLSELSAMVTGFVNEIELATQVHPSPLFQRDHRLRMLLRVFATSMSEAIAESESARSHYPPVFLNRLWELWGIVWIAKALRRLGFSGLCSVEAIETMKRCSWQLARGEVTVELDFEAEPVFIDYDRMPPAHKRNVPALEWAARHQELDQERPFLGTELKCSPDYLVRITTPRQRSLLVGDACLASPQHHGKKPDKSDSKPYTVERYRRTIGWAAGDEVVRCDPMGAFVMFPSSSCNWSEFERMPGASDCTLLCPSPRGDIEAGHRLESLLKSVVTEFGVTPG